MRLIALGVSLGVAFTIAAPAIAGPLNLPAVLVAPPMVEKVQFLPGSGFPNPTANGAAVDWCATYATNCGAGGAAQFCQQHGFAGALSWKTFHPGRTFVLGSNEYCNGAFCTGFSFVRCGGGASGAPAVIVTPPTVVVTPPTVGVAPPTGGTGPFLPGSGFPNPTANGAAVDWCATYATNCGAGGAAQFCQQHGFAGALSWKTFHPGRTFVLGSNEYCNGAFCTGFSFVRCD